METLVLESNGLTQKIQYTQNGGLSVEGGPRPFKVRKSVLELLGTCGYDDVTYIRSIECYDSGASDGSSQPVKGIIHLHDGKQMPLSGWRDNGIRTGHDAILGFNSDDYRLPKETKWVARTPCLDYMGLIQVRGTDVCYLEYCFARGLSIYISEGNGYPTRYYYDVDFRWYDSPVENINRGALIPLSEVEARLENRYKLVIADWNPSGLDKTNSHEIYFKKSLRIEGVNKVIEQEKSLLSVVF